MSAIAMLGKLLTVIRYQNDHQIIVNALLFQKGEELPEPIIHILYLAVIKIDRVLQFLRVTRLRGGLREDIAIFCGWIIRLMRIEIVKIEKEGFILADQSI